MPRLAESMVNELLGIDILGLWQPEMVPRRCCQLFTNFDTICALLQFALQFSVDGLLIIDTDISGSQT